MIVRWFVLLFAIFLGAAILPAQTFDTSGNSLLSGDYFVRYVAFSGISDSGRIGRARSLSGVATFDGNGRYSFTGQLMDTASTSATAQPYSVSGTYKVGSNGLAVVQNPINSQDVVWGALGVSALVGSSTEGAFNDLMIAIPASASAVSNSSLQGQYRVASFEFPRAQSSLAHTALFTLNANGQGNFGNADVTGNGANLGNTSVTQTVSGATYTLSGKGSGTATFPLPSGAAADSRLISGDKILYLSADGNVLLGGSANGFDFLAGVKALSGTVTNAAYQGSYAVAGIEDDASALDQGLSAISTFYGSVNSNGAGASIWHQRLAPSSIDTYDFTTDESYSLNADGTYTKSYLRQAVGGGGQAFVMAGNGQEYLFTFGVRPRTLTGTGVFLNPIGVINAASFAAFTNPICPGELISLYGSGLANDTIVNQTTSFPATLGGVSVTINGRPAPLYFVSPAQITAIVPFALAEDYAAIQVNNNGNRSNSVTVYTNSTAPGIFTLPPGGVGPGALLHADFSVVSATNPARRGETLLLFLTGLGAVQPSVADGAPGPTNPFSLVTDDILFVYVDGEPASISYAGLAPGLPGLYQINFAVPQASGSGDVSLAVETTAAFHAQTTIRVQ